MPRISIEGAVGIATGVLLLILDKMGIGGLTVYMVLFMVAAILCFDSVIRSEWATSDRSKQTIRRFGGGGNCLRGFCGAGNLDIQISRF